MSFGKFFLCKNFLSGFSFGLFGIYMALSTGLKRGIYPFAIFILMTFIGLILMAESLIQTSDSCLSKISKKELLVTSIFFLNPILANHLGFYASGFFLITGISWLIAQEKGSRVLFNILIYSAAVTIATFIIFTMLLKINTPKGILF